MSATDSVDMKVDCIVCGATQVGTWVDEAGDRKYAAHRLTGSRYPARCWGSDASVADLADSYTQANAYWASAGVREVSDRLVMPDYAWASLRLAAVILGSVDRG